MPGGIPICFPLGTFSHSCLHAWFENFLLMHLILIPFKFGNCGSLEQHWFAKEQDLDKEQHWFARKLRITWTTLVWSCYLWAFWFWPRQTYSHMVYMQYKDYRSSKIWKVVPLCVIWTIWWEQNSRTFDGVKCPNYVIKQYMLRCLYEYRWLPWVASLRILSCLCFLDLLCLRS